MKPSAEEAQKPQIIQQKSMHRKRETDLTERRIRKWGAHRCPRTKTIWQNSHACVAHHRAAVQEKDTAHVKRSARGAKRDTGLKYRTVVLEVLPRQVRRDRVSHSGVEDFS